MDGREERFPETYLGSIKLFEKYRFSLNVLQVVHQSDRKFWIRNMNHFQIIPSKTSLVRASWTWEAWEGFVDFRHHPDQAQQEDQLDSSRIEESV